ncbi:MAG: flagellar hook-associated protein FlgK [bacterium]|jgi:flagellar hook-associated protein 1 FlgK
MAGLFDGLEMGKRALATHQLSLNTVGHNISNVNTPGYTRQRVNTTTTYPQKIPSGLVGTGVKAVDIVQIRDLFLNRQFRENNKALGQWTSMEKTLTQIESIFTEPNRDSLSDLLDQFWTSWSDLANNPESMAARTALVEHTNLLTSGFNRLYRQMSDLSKSVDNDVVMTVQKVNDLAEEIASLNQQIARAELGGQKANDLRDKRDLLIDELSQYVDINSVEQKNNTATVYIGSLAIVEGVTSFKIGTRKTVAGETTASAIVWAGTTKEIKNLNGELLGMVETRDRILPDYMAKLDEMAQALISQVNSLHQTGFGLDGSTGLNFFDPLKNGAATIAINFSIAGNVNKIAASRGGEVGDNLNALAIADLRYSQVLSRGTATLSEFYNSLIGELGIDSSKAQGLKENFELLLNQIENARQAVQGVSLDEEMAQMIKFQHAFDAAARVITTMDEALVTVIQDMGLVGN